MSKPTHHIFVCVNRRIKDHPRSSCAEKDAEEVLKKFMEVVGERGLHRRVFVSASDCMAPHCTFDPCPLGPVVIVYPEGVWYKGVNMGDVDRILRQHIVGGRKIEELEIDPKDFSSMNYEIRSQNADSAVFRLRKEEEGASLI